MPPSLPARPNLEWLKKTAKAKLKALREARPSTRLADAQLEVAREYGFASWRKLKHHIEQREPQPQPTRDHVVQGFLRLVGNGEIEQVRRVLAASPQMVNAVGPHPFWGGRAQPLHVAIETKRRDLFDLLLEAGADVNGANDQYDHWSPLMLTVNRERADMRDELLRRGAHVGLLEALLLADDERVEEVLRPGASALPPHVPNAGSLLNLARTPFAIDRLMELGASAELTDRWGTNAIEAMSKLGPEGLPLVEHLIARGVAARPEDYARLGDRRMLEAAVNAEPGVAKSDAVMMAAVDFGHHALVEWLLTKGANVNARTNAESRHTALHAAAWGGDLAMVQLLVAAGADVTIRDDEHHSTPREWAAVSIRVSNNPACRAVVDWLASRES